MYKCFIKGLMLSATLIFMTATANAQEGHPLKGSWIGEWSDHPLGDFVLVVMDWNGSEVTGMINPGTDNLVIESVVLNPEDWSVEIKAGDYTVTGTIENLELPSRSVTGSWSGGRRERGDFEIVRQ